MDIIVNALKELLLEVNPLKSAFMVFSRKRAALERDIAFKIQGVVVHPVDTCKYLGLTLDSKLSWTSYINERCVNAIKKIFSLRRYLRLTWGLQMSTYLTFYKSTIIPFLLYGSPVWGNALKRKHIQKKLSKSTTSCFTLRHQSSRDMCASPHTCLNSP